MKRLTRAACAELIRKRPTRATCAELVRLAIAVAIAATATGLIWASLPQDLNIQTDVVGSPTFRAFNINRYFWAYGLGAVFFPVVTIALYVGFQWFARRGQPRQPRRPPSVGESEPEHVRSPASIRVAAITGALFVGAVFGLELSVHDLRVSGGMLARTSLVYTALLVVVALALARLLARPFFQLLSTVNAAVIPLTIVGLYGVSETTKVKVGSNGATHHYGFLPLWLALIAVLALFAWLVLSWRRSGGFPSSHAIERRAILVIAMPVALYLYVAAIPSTGGPIDMFHEGETLAAAQLTQAGAFPWRDLLFIHGLLQDVFRSLVGIELYGDSRWGAIAGQTLILRPIAWLSLYAFCAYLFRRNWLFVLGTQVALVGGAVTAIDFRFFLCPIVVLLLIALLRKATVTRAVVFTSLLVVQMIVSPEASLATFAFAASLVAFDFYYRDRARPLVENFRRTLLCAASGVIIGVAWIVFLASFGALGSFFSYYRTFAPDHQLTGGLPINFLDARFEFAALAPIALGALALCFFAIRIRFRWPIRPEDWAMGGMALFMCLYYTKYLGRADGHVYEAYSIAVPVLFYAVYRAIELLAARPPRFRTVSTNALVSLALVVTLAKTPSSLANLTRLIPSHFVVAIENEPLAEHVGYAAPDAVDMAMVKDLQQIAKAYLGPEDTVFDFSNNPALFHYLLRLRPATRYYHVSMAIRQEAQADLISELAKRRPKLVFYTAYSGLPGWDGIVNQVRHYDVSQYLLDHYRPLFVSHGFLLMARNGVHLPTLAGVARNLSEQPSTTGLYFQAPSCDWGATPNFLTTGPSDTSKTQPLTLGFRREPGITIQMTGWAVDQDAHKPALEVVAAVGGRVIARNPVNMYRSDVATYFHDPGFTRAGFGFIMKARLRSLAELRFYAVTRAGRAVELTYGPATQWRPEVGKIPSKLTLPNGDLLRTVASGVLQANADNSTLWTQTLQLDSPAHAERYHWLEIEARKPLSTDRFTLSDEKNLGFAATSIVFNTLARGRQTARVQVGACSQWRGYRGSLWLASNNEQEISAVRLYR